MRISKSTLKQIIKEEINKVLMKEDARLVQINNAFDSDQQEKLNDIFAQRLSSDRLGASTYGSKNVSPLDSVIHQAINNGMDDDEIIRHLEYELEEYDMDMDY